MTSSRRAFYANIGAGGVLGILILHPLVKAVYWMELRHETAIDRGFWQFMVHRLQTDFLFEAIPMTLVFGVIGGLIGAGFGAYQARLATRERALRQLEHELGRDLPSLVAAGESERTEFKTSARWDARQGKVNKALEVVIAKSIVGFMNHLGGNLLIGVDDRGSIVGLEKDYETLKAKNRDGFAQCIMEIVKTRLGGDKCSLVHTIFDEVEGRDVCRVVVEPSGTPVYCTDGKVARYYLRTGNGTRELDAREVVAHVAEHR